MRGYISTVALFILIGSAPLAVAQSQSAESLPEHAEQTCLDNHLLHTAFDCSCVASKAAQQSTATANWHDAFVELINSEALRVCIQPESIRAESLLKCGRGYRLHRHLDRKKIGKAGFCHCVTDMTIQQLPQTDMKSVPTRASGSGSKKAIMACGKLSHYPVPADSIFLPAAPKPVPVVGDAVRIKADDQAVFLIVLNKNFDIGLLDYARYAVSDTWDNAKPNDSYVTPKINPVNALPQAITDRGAKVPGKIDPRDPMAVVDIAYSSGAAILVRGRDLVGIMKRIERKKGISSVDYYLVSGDQIYAVLDPVAHLDAL